MSNTTSSVSKILTNTNYSTVNKYNNNYSTVVKNNKTTVQYSNLTDVINEEYIPWYDKQRKLLGDKRFMELVAKARQGSDTPKILFRWMLNNPELVR